MPKREKMLMDKGRYISGSNSIEMYVDHILSFFIVLHLRNNKESVFIRGY